MKIPSYARYKNSESLVADRIPDHWIDQKLKHRINGMIAGGTPESGNDRFWTESGEGLPWVSIADISISDHICETMKDITIAGLRAKQLTTVPAGSILYSIFASLGKVAEAGVDLVTNQAILALSIQPEIDKGFLKFWLRHLEQFLDLYCTSNTQKNLNAEKVRNLPLAYAPLPEQKQIAKFLDHETAKIDLLIAKQQALIALLKEKRQAVISHAVTKGLNPNAKMKDSGVEWLGQVPEHWYRKSLNYLIAHTVDNRGRTPPVTDSGIPMCEVSQVAGDGFYTSKNYSKFITQGSYEQFVRSDVKENDVLFVTVGATFGKTCLVPPSPDFFIAQNVVGFRCKQDVDPKFFMFLLSSEVFKEAISATNKSSTIDNVKVSDLVKTKLVIPPYEEQREIVDHIFTIVDEFELLISKSESASDLLQERRTALISAAVTGKIDVRDWEPAAEVEDVA